MKLQLFIMFLILPIDRYLRRMVHLLETSDLNVRIAAGEILALMYEIGRSIDRGFVGDNNGLSDLLRELSRDGTKHKAKKDLRLQRSSFRDILNTVEVSLTLSLLTVPSPKLVTFPK